MREDTRRAVTPCLPGSEEREPVSRRYQAVTEDPPYANPTAHASHLGFMIPMAWKPCPTGIARTADVLPQRVPARAAPARRGAPADALPHSAADHGGGSSARSRRAPACRRATKRPTRTYVSSSRACERNKAGRSGRPLLTHVFSSTCPQSPIFMGAGGSTVAPARGGGPPAG